MMYCIFRLGDGGVAERYYVETTSLLTSCELHKLQWLIAETFFSGECRAVSPNGEVGVVEVGPRLSIETPFSSNAVSICRAIGLVNVVRVEKTCVYSTKNVQSISFDRTTEQLYINGITSFQVVRGAEEVRSIDLVRNGIAELQKMNSVCGLGMDSDDVSYYFNLFVHVLRRNPTDVELFQLGNANSEHSRHWFFKGKLIIDGVVVPTPLFELVQQLLHKIRDVSQRSLVAFRDNASVIRGWEVPLFMPDLPGHPSSMVVRNKYVHLTCTAETHNHPTFVAPFPGGQTGSGGRIRDVSAVGRGGNIGIGVAGYFVGNLFLQNHEIPGEQVGKDKPSTYASPLSILIEGSDGVSSYGNQFGEPLTLGFVRTFGQVVDGEWREPRKPILYSGGVGHVLDEHVQKEKIEIGMKLVRFGGPAYPIGVGGGAASSMVQGQNSEVLDFASVQRGNAEMENRANRVIRACIEMETANPISVIHDQGAGGLGNVFTELLEPLGGKIDIRNVVLGDKTMSVLSIWNAEFQEGYGILVRSHALELFQNICRRERVDCEVLGEVDGGGSVVVFDKETGTTPVSLDISQVLTNMPKKIFNLSRREKRLQSLQIPDLSIADVLPRLFALPSVGSKGYLVHKVDRSVTGLVAQQQTCGIAQIPIANVSVQAQSYFGLTGSAAAIGEQPIKMLVDSKAGARMVVGEMLTNMVSVHISALSDVRCRANWMWPAKLPNEGALLYDAASAMVDVMIELGIGIDGGKDSLSMAAMVSDEIVKSPGSLVLLGYAPVPDIRKKVTPAIQKPGKSILVLIDLGCGKQRLGGSAFAQVFGQLGDISPDVDDPQLLKNVFLFVQELLEKNIVLALHDRSDGGLITTVAEMCMASRCGFRVCVPSSSNVLSFLCNEELGIVLEIDKDCEEEFRSLCIAREIPFSVIGSTQDGVSCDIFSHDARLLFSSTVMTLRGWWDATSVALERIQVGDECAEQERQSNIRSVSKVHESAVWSLSFSPEETSQAILWRKRKEKVVVLREEGTNGDREMLAACFAAGFDAWDVTMSDLIEGRIDLDGFRGIVFAGGFSYMDVFGSAKGWAGVILYNEKLREMFEKFYARPDTFSLGVCNGCQLMTLLGWVPWRGIDSGVQPRFIKNVSGRFESRWVQVEILPSPSIFFSGMQGSRLGVWIAHGEGRLFFPDESVATEVITKQLAPLAFIDASGWQTMEYPHNPNGSYLGITALCSPDGRHLAMMPHPERSFRLWQFPWMPDSWRALKASPWMQMFQNARKWCSSLM